METNKEIPLYLVEGRSQDLTIVSFFRDNEEEALSEQS